MWLDPRFWIALGLALLGAYGSGRWQQWRADEKSHAAAMAIAAERTREAERNAEKANRGISDALSEANRRALESERLASERLRALSAARSEAAAACSRLDAPAAAVVHGSVVDDLVALASRADETARQLQACQSYITEVVKP